MQNDDISRCFFFFHFFNIFIFGAVREVKGSKMAQDGKKNWSVAVDISVTILSYDFYLWYT